MADDVHEILNGTKPGNIPIYHIGARLRKSRKSKSKSRRVPRPCPPPALLAQTDEVTE